MEFGPEIKIPVLGEKPDFIRDNDIVSLDGVTGPASSWVFDSEEGGYHLLADHPYYQQNTPAPDERAVVPELVERMRQLVEDAASDEPGGRSALRTEARAIVAALEPVDDDLETAEAIMKTIGYRDIDPASDVLKVALAAIKRGRQLEKEGK